jgi:hypothetical protein
MSWYTGYVKSSPEQSFSLMWISTWSNSPARDIITCNRLFLTKVKYGQADKYPSSRKQLKRNACARHRRKLITALLDLTFGCFLKHQPCGRVQNDEFAQLFGQFDPAVREVWGSFIMSTEIHETMNRATCSQGLDGKECSTAVRKYLAAP